MSLEENSVPFTMPVAPAYGGYGNNGGFGFGGDWAWILLLLLIGGNGWGMGGFGMGGMMPWMMSGMGAGFGLDYLYPWLNNSQHISDGFRDQNLQTSISGLQNSVTAGFGDVQNALCGGFAGVNQSISQTGNAITGAINSGFNAAEIAANGRQMANMQQGFGLQSAMMQGFNAAQAQAADCCCKTQTNIADLKYAVATENCADRAAISDGIRDLLAATQAQTQTILNQLCSDKIEAKNDTIAQLRSELLYARGQASQDVQTAAIQAGQRALANEVEQYVAPRAIPSYQVANPYCCNYTGCGCGAA